MDTPTPVSALLHAGIINAGGFIILRLADVLALCPSAWVVLAIVGGATALFGSLAAITQPTAKVALAYSTVGQMGFMLLELGVGAFSLALVHIVAHSLYKAHAFLWSGRVVTRFQPKVVSAQQASRGIAALVVALVVFTVGYLLVAGSIANDWVGFGLGLVLALSVGHFMGTLLREEVPGASGLLRTAAAAGGVAILYFLVKSGSAALLAPLFPVAAPVAGLPVFVLAVALCGFLAISILQLTLFHDGSSRWGTTLRVHLKNGFYLNAIFDRWLAPRSGTDLRNSPGGAL